MLIMNILSSVQQGPEYIFLTPQEIHNPPASGIFITMILHFAWYSELSDPSNLQKSPQTKQQYEDWVPDLA
jgi:hypothetical protein